METAYSLADHKAAIRDAGQDVTLSHLENCIMGTRGFAILSLVRDGEWIAKERHNEPHPNYGWTRYGPI